MIFQNFYTKAKQRWNKIKRSSNVTLPLSVPYPYKCMIAISTDCEGMAWENKLRLFRLLCSKNSFNFDIADSMFFYVTNSDFEDSYSYFDGTTNKINLYAPIIREMIQAGYIDTIHAYGDFDRGGFTRKMAESVFEECQKHKLQLSVWSNHGSNKNVQNVGHQMLTDYQRGDLPNSEVYHLDILREIGVKYFWLDGQFMDSPNSDMPIVASQAARDGSEIITFNRYRGLNGLPAPNAGSLSQQVLKADIENLILNNRSCIFYQHLGIKTKTQEGKFINNTYPFFDEPGYEILNFLKRMYEEKKCLVTSTSKVLRFLHAVQNLKIETYSNSVLLKFNLKKDEVEMSGIGFEVGPDDPLQVSVRFKDSQILPLTGFRKHRISSKKFIIYFPWSYLPEYIW